MDVFGVLMAWSALGAVVVSLAVAWNERRGQVVAVRVRARPAYRGNHVGGPARDHLDPPRRDCGR